MLILITLSGFNPVPLPDLIPKLCQKKVQIITLKIMICLLVDYRDHGLIDPGVNDAVYRLI
jgi:hypothetical protein